MRRILVLSGILALALACSDDKEYDTTLGDGGSDDTGTADGGTADDGGATGDGGSDDTGDGGATGDGGSDDTGTTGFTAPRSGVWEYTEGDVTQDPCGLEAAASSMGDELAIQVDGPFTLTDNGDGTFTVAPEDGTASFDCTLDGADFTCGERLAQEVDLSGAGLPATLEFQASASGSFSSDTAMAGQQVAAVDCVGDACGTVEGMLGVTFPCDVTVDFTAVYAE